MTVGIIVNALKEGDSDKYGASFPVSKIVEVAGFSSIGAAYNKAVEHSTAEVLVFTHADVELWAYKKLWDDMIAVCQDPKIGFVGVVGTTKLDKSAVWYANPSQTRGAINALINKRFYSSAYGMYGPVQVLNGVLLACRREIALEFPFPTDTGPYFYDIDTTYRASKKYQNMVVPLPLCQESKGFLVDQSYQEWEDARNVFLKRFGHEL